jgi:hypothetical protein
MQTVATYVKTIQPGLWHDLSGDDLRGMELM